ncbi:MAG: AIR synthase related protein, partial [Chloroflexota bacterium]|nr:AIR synthase related protein [Chloroflexota bacterium]
MQAGKLPIEQLSKILQKFTSRDPRVALGPTPGEDAALIDMGESYLVAKTDPITFATNRIGWYAVQVNANDIAVMGAKPKWMMATILLPEGTSENAIEQIFSQLDEACNNLNITIIGGHTEITYDLSRPLITGVMLGEVEKGKEIRSSGARSGDSIILTKSIAIEGCSILARECETKLRSYGVSSEDIDEGKNLLDNPGISIVRDAEIALASGRVTSMHDPT